MRHLDTTTKVYRALRLIAGIIVVMLLTSILLRIVGVFATRGTGGSGGIDPTKITAVDLDQPRELRMKPLPRHIVMPADEISITMTPNVLEIGPGVQVVQPDGYITLGKVGEISVYGLTLDQIADKVKEQVVKAIATADASSVKVSAWLERSQSRFYYVVGTVTSSGSFPSTGNETVMDAILRAGIRSNSDLGSAILVRPGAVGEASKVLKIDWDGIVRRGDTTTNYQVLPGDRIYVPGGPPPGLISSLLGY